MSTATRKAPKSTSASKTSKTTKTATKSKTTAAKKPVDAAAVPAASKSATPATATTVTPTVVDAPQAVITGPMMRKKELVETVVARSGMKKKDVKPVVETMLSVLGEALGDNRELNLPPFGRLKVRREKNFAKGRMVVAKIRQPQPPVASETPASSKDTD